MTLPNFLIVGAAKSGTTALYHYLKQHPDIFMPELIKEPMFFSGIHEGLFKGPTQIYARGKITTIDQYIALFQQANGQIAVGEASVPYLYYHARTIPKIIEVLDKHIKIIISLRHPAERAYSNYLHHVRDGLEPLGFAEALEEESGRCREKWWWGYQYRDASRYYSQVKAYIDAFGRENIHVILYEDLKQQPQATLQGIFRFLAVDEQFVPDVSQRHNVSLVPKNPSLQDFLRQPHIVKNLLKPLLPMGLHKKLKERVIRANMTRPPELDGAMRHRLVNEFREDIEKLQMLLGRDLSSWLS